MMVRVLRFAGIFYGLCMVSAAHAATVCSVSATGVAFGSYNPLSSVQADITGTITLTCDKDRTDYSIIISTGNGGVFSGRVMTHASHNLPYQIYIDSAHTVIWGDGSGGTSVVSGTLPKGQTSVSFTVYGRLYGGSNVVPGFYTDGLLVTSQYK